jgi:hypothetical protein
VSVQELKALARKHWEEWLPERVRELRAEGKLDEALLGLGATRPPDEGPALPGARSPGARAPTIHPPEAGAGRGGHAATARGGRGGRG